MALNVPSCDQNYADYEIPILIPLVAKLILNGLK